MFIEESHERCKKNNLKCTQIYSKKILDEKEFFHVTEKNNELILAAVPIMNKIYDFVKGSNFFLVLTDKDGCILNVIGDEEIVAEAFSFKMVPGAYMNEENIGTNAMGTCLIEGKPLQVSGNEHFITAYHRWTCSASPIMDSDGNIIGALDLTGYNESVHIHTLGIVVAGAKAIENELECIKLRHTINQQKEYGDLILNSVLMGVIIVNADGSIINANNSASEFFGIDMNDLINMNISNLIKNWSNIFQTVSVDKQVFKDDVDILSNKNHLQLNLTAYPTLYSNDTAYVTLVFNEVRKQRKMIDKIVGRRAIYTFDKIIGKNVDFLNVIEYAKKIADSRSNILIMGESGTGKELFAQSIHNQSNRANGPFIALNCAAIPRNLIESELFGYDEGSFTGAKAKGNPGKFEIADGGTIFLDEIGEMPLDLQTRFLRVIEEGTVSRIGSSQVRVVDVRVIAATNKNLSQEVENGTFRNDLYYRLNVLPLRLPSLRERRDDIKILIDYFMEKISRKLNKKMVYISEERMNELTEYDWPGNVRELENFVELIINTEYVPNIYDLHKSNVKYNNTTSDSVNLPTLKDLEKDHIIKVIKFTDNNITQSANILGIGRNTLYRKLKEYNIECYIMEHSSKMKH
jgi:transcriptional regulator of acetoin/glycerol metabolism